MSVFLTTTSKQSGRRVRPRLGVAAAAAEHASEAETP